MRELCLGAGIQNTGWEIQETIFLNHPVNTRRRRRTLSRRRRALLRLSPPPNLDTPSSHPQPPKISSPAPKFAASFFPK